MHHATMVGDVVDLSDGRVPAAVALARELAAVERARREHRRAAQRARVRARTAMQHFGAAHDAGWSSSQLAAAGLVPSDAVRSLAHEPDDPEV